MARHQKKIVDIGSAVVLLALIALDAALWNTIVNSAKALMADDARTGASGSIYFLPVAQGESSLLVLPGGALVLTDAGADAGIVNDLQQVLPAGAPPYIDLAIISSPQPADYGGYQYVLQHYRVGAFLYNGRADTAHANEWAQLMDAIASRHIPLITAAAGDRIRFDAGALAAGEIDILSPDGAFARSPDPADTGIVERVVTPGVTALLAADIGTNVEGALLAPAGAGGAGDLRADILKAPFPGLGTVAGDAFLRAVAPRVIVVMPGVKNTASAPTKAMLAHLASSTRAAVVSPKPGQFLLYNK